MGMPAFWLRAFRLLITAVVMAAVTFLCPKHRRAVFSASKRAFWIGASAGLVIVTAGVAVCNHGGSSAA